MMNKELLPVLVWVVGGALFAFPVIAISLSGFGAAGTNPALQAGVADVSLPGFWFGLWHGLIHPFSFLVSLFSDKVLVYEIYNNGGWYDWGFISGITFVAKVISIPDRSNARRKSGLLG